MSTANQKLGYLEYCQLAEDGNVHEIMDGDHYMNPPPSPYHQAILGNLHFQLYAQVKSKGLGQVFVAPTDVQLSAHDIVQPDIVVILNERQDIVTPSRIVGSPNLVVEILSDSTASRDKQLKMQLYRRSCIPEYWLVDAKAKRVTQLVFQANDYVEFGRYSRRAFFSCTTWKGFCQLP
ncbi:MAG: Uma2 family endonuclease [Pirellulaceae bacterium]